VVKVTNSGEYKRQFGDTVQVRRFKLFVATHIHAPIVTKKHWKKAEEGTHIIMPDFLLKNTLLSKNSPMPHFGLALEYDVAMLFQGSAVFHFCTLKISWSVLLPPPAALS
jgi:hypothetical protein